MFQEESDRNVSVTVNISNRCMHARDWNLFIKFIDNPLGNLVVLIPEIVQYRNCSHWNPQEARQD